MHEMEFLPGWYPQLHRRKRMVMLQLWATLLVAVALALWVVLAKGNAGMRQRDRTAIAAQLDQSRRDLKDLNEQLSQKQRLEADERIVSKVGLHVETTRLLAKIDQLMPPEMTLTEANFDTVEPAKPRDPRAENRPPEMTRLMTVKLTGVTPSDADWAGVLAKLSSIPYFQEVRLIGAKDEVDKGHLMRQFEISFMVDLGSGG